MDIQNQKINWNDREERIQYYKNYASKNKQTLKEKQSRYVECPTCKSQVQYCYLSKHLKTKLCKKKASMIFV